MCRYCRHKDLAGMQQGIEAKFHPRAFGGSEKLALAAIGRRIAELRSNRKALQRAGETTYVLDHERDKLKFAAMALNHKNGWRNGGNLFV